MPRCARLWGCVYPPLDNATLTIQRVAAAKPEPAACWQRVAVNRRRPGYARGRSADLVVFRVGWHSVHVSMLWPTETARNGWRPPLRCRRGCRGVSARPDRAPSSTARIQTGERQSALADEVRSARGAAWSAVFRLELLVEDRQVRQAAREAMGRIQGTQRDSRRGRSGPGNRCARLSSPSLRLLAPTCCRNRFRLVS